MNDITIVDVIKEHLVNLKCCLCKEQTKLKELNKKKTYINFSLYLSELELIDTHIARYKEKIHVCEEWLKYKNNEAI